MKLHTNTLTAADISDAARLASAAYTTDDNGKTPRPIAAVGVARDSRHGSRSRARAFDVILTGDATHATQSGDGRGASWDQWGLFLAVLFDRDPSLTVPGVYVDAEHFAWSTGDRYGVGRDGSPFIVGHDYHRRHRWEYTGTAAGNRYAVNTCNGCAAHTRRLIGGHQWEELSA
ncbi:hypothetical protein KNU02_gp93 [Gordonia phage Pleakley]|uniref:Uncharacterized protein n=1 Tax=Gordonia phage Pleakley TaxID=2283246 RepID=A0A345M6L1_9CAUD|nr:hypothetical protein KNU02_gp93 [Gordonia phage Pleakley]AXH49818.1 hypothetical protein SEA_FURY_93 [Gordonia phage Fury]AXH66132.1 hypothetical protein SEA_PLEAKLEY_93 [Gordonia phage Pleakley]